MSAIPGQQQLDLAPAVQPLDEVVVSAKVLLGRPEVEYTLIWVAPNTKRQVQKMYLDAVWPLDKIIPRIFALIWSCHDGGAWEPKKVRAVLDALQSAYGCEEPF